MPIHLCNRLILTAAALCVISLNPASAQAPAQKKPMMLVTWFGPGGILIPNGPD
jgi:tripartite-type tricarboxylate transporter receptor subunit TctC